MSRALSTSAYGGLIFEIQRYLLGLLDRLGTEQPEKGLLLPKDLMIPQIRALVDEDGVRLLEEIPKKLRRFLYPVQGLFF